MANTYLPGVITTPSSLVVTAATRSYPMVITVSVENVAEVQNYSVGMAVRLFVPRSYGMLQANGLTGTITAISGSDFTLDIDSSLFDAFVTPSSTAPQPASVSPAGSRNLTYTNNTSSTVPFHSLNNIGN